MSYIIIYGNPVEGHIFVGPFAGRDEAFEYAEFAGGGDWWVAELGAPAEED